MYSLSNPYLKVPPASFSNSLPMAAAESETFNLSASILPALISS